MVISESTDGAEKGDLGLYLRFPLLLADLEYVALVLAVSGTDMFSSAGKGREEWGVTTPQFPHAATGERQMCDFVIGLGTGKRPLYWQGFPRKMSWCVIFCRGSRQLAAIPGGRAADSPDKPSDGSPSRMTRRACLPFPLYAWTSCCQHARSPAVRRSTRHSAITGRQRRGENMFVLVDVHSVAQIYGRPLVVVLCPFATALHLPTAVLDPAPGGTARRRA
ncbi:hypothetical protein NUW54_g10061 [Trametes sanguinea]|uniref:Uncharacterized protein n=1 Tax=Trametes sanguinea TaxID=158606 RepID=A0ACC1P2Z5_9APHY|nr:hypothetical protein NUW54_g10061 [Trametes sanguinea]